MTTPRAHLPARRAGSRNALASSFPICAECCAWRWSRAVGATWALAHPVGASALLIPPGVACSQPRDR
eukprot:7805732-Alexandrium_andersonii.AAC.1